MLAADQREESVNRRPYRTRGPRGGLVRHDRPVAVSVAGYSVLAGVRPYLVRRDLLSGRLRSFRCRGRLYVAAEGREVAP